MLINICDKTRNQHSVCDSEQDAARVLGYSKLAWDDKSGQALQPWSSIKRWTFLTDTEKEAAMLLGYNERSWDNKSGLEAQPA